MLRFLCALSLVMGILLLPAQAAEKPILLPLRIHTSSGEHNFMIEPALTPQQQAKGLMGRTKMDDDYGMLFPISPPQPMTMWMENTLIPLDIVFIGPDRRIVRIVTGQPLDRTLLPSGGSVIAALELKGGITKKLGIRAGDRVEW